MSEQEILVGIEVYSSKRGAYHTLNKLAINYDCYEFGNKFAVSLIIFSVVLAIVSTSLVLAKPRIDQIRNAEWQYLETGYLNFWIVPYLWWILFTQGEVPANQTIQSFCNTGLLSICEEERNERGTGPVGAL